MTSPIPSMIQRIQKGLTLVRNTVIRHGGGWSGIYSMAARSVKVVRALGWKGFLQRIRHSQQGAARTIAPAEAVSFPQAAPIDGSEFRVGIMAHVFYLDLLEELANDLRHMPVPFVLMISVANESAKVTVHTHFRKASKVSALYVRVVPNRGRDLAPFLLSFRDEILSLDLVCHIHTKKSLYTGSTQNAWRRYLIEALFGSDKRISWILGMFKAMPSLGMIYPESFASVPLWAHTWLSNAEQARELSRRLDIHTDITAYIDYPAGSMFWARSTALRPLYALELTLKDFPEEHNQTDGTLQHAIERMLGLVVRQRHMLLGIMPADGSLRLTSEGSRNWETYFRFSVEDKVRYAAIDARIVSFDLFDTLLLRPFLHPSGARAYLGYLVESQFGLTNFAALRTRIEAMLRAKSGRDVDCAAIYDAMARLGELRGLPVASIRELELSTEQRLLKQRTALVDAAHAIAQSGKRIIAVSDMYLNARELRDVMPSNVSTLLQQIHVSCENGWRKDTDEAWRHLPGIENTPPEQWLHVGDNEHSDVQRPQALGFIHPVHILRPSALLDVVPALRGLRPKPQQKHRWEDQLWLGLVANRFAELADRSPEVFGHTLLINEPETLGYTAIGPLVLDYIAWTARLALEKRARKILFLSREGYLLQRIYLQLQKAVPSLQAIDGVYLLASRRGVSTPGLYTVDDLVAVFTSPYTGSLRNLLQVRLGMRIAAIAARNLNETAMNAEVFLPGMEMKIIDLLRSSASAVLNVAKDERDGYLEYWHSHVNDPNAIVADIGYAGTIQTQLARLTGQMLGGAYFAVKESIAQVQIHNGWAHARFHDARMNNLDLSPVMRHHLMLEAIFTSPDGQFSHFESGPKKSRAIYLSNGPHRLRWQIIERIQAGAEHFVRDVCDVTAADSLQLAFDNTLVQEPLSCVGSQRWHLGTWGNSLLVEDHYSGRGEVDGRIG